MSRDTDDVIDESKASYFKAWFLILVVAVLELCIFCCFLGFLGQKSHHNYCQLRDLHAWPWNWRSRYGLRDFFISACIYPTAMIFMLFREFSGLRIPSNYRRSRDHHAWPKNWRSRHGLRDNCYLGLYLSYRDDCFFLFRKVLGSGN